MFLYYWCCNVDVNFAVPPSSVVYGISPVEIQRTFGEVAN